MRERPEHRGGWHQAFEIGGERFLVEARHHTRRRMPRGHEIAARQAHGRVWSQVEETDHQWAVVGMGRVVCMLKQAPSGDFRSGPVPFARMTLIEAAKAAVLHHVPRLRPQDSASRAVCDQEPETGYRPA